MKNKTHNESSSKRLISKQRFDKIRTALKAAYDKVEQFLMEVLRLEKLITEKSVILEPENKSGKPITKKLSAAEKK